MSKRLILGLLLALMAVLLAACEVEEEVEDPEPTLAAQTPAAATAQATPRLPAEASPTAQATPRLPPEASPTPQATPTPPAEASPPPQATPTLPAEPSLTPQATATAPPTNLDWEKAEQAAEEDRAKPRFRGEIGDFAIVEPNSASNYPCPEPYGPATSLEDSELYFNLPGAVIDSIGTGSCQGTVISIQAGVPGESGGATVGRGYVVGGPKVRVSYDAPVERLELMTVAGKPAIAVLPLPHCVSCVTDIAVIERFPTEAAPGIVAWVHTLESLDTAIALLEQMMMEGKQ